MKEKIKQARKEAGLSQQELSEAIGIQQAQVSKWETGKAVPYTSTLAKISEATGKPVNWFTATEDMVLDLARDLPEKTLGALMKASHGHKRTPQEEAVSVIIEKYSD